MKRRKHPEQACQSILCPIPLFSLSLSHQFHSIKCLLSYIIFSLKAIIFQVLCSSHFLLFISSIYPALSFTLILQRTKFSAQLSLSPPERVREQKHTSHLKMTSSFYTAANQMQAHGSLPLWMRSVHKMGRQRCRIKDKSKTKLAKCKNPLQQHFMAVLPWCQTCSSKLMHIYMHTESGASFIQRLSEFINTSCVAGSQRQTKKKKLGLMLPAELPQTACVKEKNSNGINYLRSSCDSRLQKT